MAIIIWLIMGGLAGWVASMIAGTNQSQGVVGNVVVGAIGALVGGWLMTAFGMSGATLSTFNLYSFIVAVIGAVIVLFIYRVLTKR